MPWEEPARPLPLGVRPFGGETVVSYVVRLAAANHVRYTTLFRQLARCSPYEPQAMVLDRDAFLDQAALARLAVLSGVAAERLWRALPILHVNSGRPVAIPEPLGVPELAWVRLHRFEGPFWACPACILRHPTSTAVRIVLADGEHLCTRHRYWLRYRQIDLAGAPEITAAQLAYRKLQRRHQPRELAAGRYDAEWIVQGWRRHPCHHDLNGRWDARHQALDPGEHRTADPVADLAVALPETVALADLLAGYYQQQVVSSAIKVHVCKRLRLPYRTAFCGSDPLTRWAATFERTAGNIGRIR
jgi:hypothetical protein